MGNESECHGQFLSKLLSGANIEKLERRIFLKSSTMLVGSALLATVPFASVFAKGNLASNSTPSSKLSIKMLSDADADYAQRSHIDGDKDFAVAFMYLKDHGFTKSVVSKAFTMKVPATNQTVLGMETTAQNDANLEAKIIYIYSADSDSLQEKAKLCNVFVPQNNLSTDGFVAINGAIERAGSFRVSNAEMTFTNNEGQVIKRSLKK